MQGYDIALKGHLLVISYGADESKMKIHDSRAKFWDVVGDMIMVSVWQSLTKGQQPAKRTMYLLPATTEDEGYYYSKQAVFDLSEKAMCRIVMFAGENVRSARNHHRISERQDEIMAEKVNLPSLAGYKRQLEQRENGAHATTEITTSQSKQALSISPLSNNKAAKISESAHKQALQFAHTVDQSIITALDNPVVNTVFNKVVQASIDANYGLALAKGIHVSPNTYGDLYEIVAGCAAKLNIPIPYVIISDTVQGINACTAGTDQFAFIAISSFLPLVMNRDELAFVIGHECGHLALGHVVYHTALNVFGSAGGLLPLIGGVIEKTIQYPLNAWSRRSEISADRAGLICCGDINVAKRALFKIEAGLLRTDTVDIDTYVREAEQVLEQTTIGKFSEIMYSHPIIPKRIKALDCFSRSQLYDRLTGKGNASSGRLLTDSDLASSIEKIIEIKM